MVLIFRYLCLIIISCLISTTSMANSQEDVKIFSDIMFGEGENQTPSAKLDLARFLYSESIKNNRTPTEELKSKKSGGAFKYSSVQSSLKRRKKKNPMGYIRVQQFAQNNLETIYKTYNTMNDYNHYITVDLAKKNPPKWFKYHIVKWKISGDHIFVQLNFHKSSVLEYNSFINELKTIQK